MDSGRDVAMRVLLVEDEVRLATALRRGLIAEGFNVDVVHDGREGLWRARENAYDVLVLDIMLPGMNGYKVCETLRAGGVWTPVLMLTAKDGEYDQTDAFDLGADDYLTKPFSFIVLVARLRALIRRGAPERPTVLQVGDLILDPSRRSVERAGVELNLTPREFGLLHFLIRNCGHVVTKTQILEGVWDANYDGDPNVVEVYISYLRKKVDQPFGRSTIQTVRGVGYRLADAKTDVKPDAKTSLKSAVKSDTKA
jgi:two-component system, OmpR family, response regulator